MMDETSWGVRNAETFHNRIELVLVMIYLRRASDRPALLQIILELMSIMGFFIRV